MEKSKFVKVIIQNLPFSSHKEEKEFEAGLNIREIIERLGIDFEDFSGSCQLNGIPVRKVFMEGHKPEPGSIINLIIIPGGGNLGKTLMSVAIFAAASWLAGPIMGLARGSLLKSVVTTAMAGLMSKALIPPQQQNTAAMVAAGRDPTVYSITGTGNASNINGVIPQIFGTRGKYYPPLAAEPVTQLIGNDQYLIMLFCLGYGRVSIADQKIGETAIASFSGVTSNTMEGAPNDAALSIYTHDMTQTDISTILTQSGGAVTRTSAAGATQLAVDIDFPNGLFEIQTSGARVGRTVVVTVHTSPTGAGTWTLRDTLTVNENSTSTVRSGTLITGLAAGQYDVKLTRTTADTATTGVYDVVYWRDIKSISPAVPVNIKQIGLIEMRIKASDQLNSIIDKFNCTISRYIPVYKGTYTDISAAAADQSLNSVSTDFTTLFTLNQWIQISGFVTSGNNANPTCGAKKVKITSIAANKIVVADLDSSVVWALANRVAGDPVVLWGEEVSSNPAWAYCDVIRGQGAKNPVADTRLDLSGLNAWAGRCAAAGRKYDDVIDGATTIRQALSDIAAAGRASFTFLDGKFSVVEDIDQVSAIKQVITPRNSWGLRSVKQFIPAPHAFKMQFQNKDADYRWDERIVYATGYTSANATLFENVRMKGICDPDQVWKTGMYYHAVTALRPEVHTVNMDFENLAIEGRGNLVLLNTDILLIGLHSGRVVSVTLNGGGDCTHITVDEKCTMAAGTDYGIQVRKSDFTFVTGQIVTNAGDQTVLQLTVPIGVGNPMPVAGDLFDFGVHGSESARCIVRAIRRGPDHTAEIDLVDEGPAIYTSDSGAIPAWTSNITIPALTRQGFPPDPYIINLRSDETVLKRQGRYGDLISCILISFMPQDRLGVQASTYEARYKRHTENQWKRCPASQADSNEILIEGVEDGIAYDVQVRSVSQYGLASDWITGTGAISLTNYTIVGKSNPPSDVTGLTATVEGNGIRLNWSKIDDLDIGWYEIRYWSLTGDWAAAAATAKNVGDVDTWLWPSLPYDGTGGYLFFIKAHDTSKNESTNACVSANFLVAKPSTPVPTATVTDNQVVITCPPVTSTFPIDTYWFYYTNSGGTLIGKSKTNTLSVPAMAAGAYTFAVYATDSYGTISAAGTVACTITGPGTPIDDGSVAEHNIANLKYTTVKTSFAIDYYEIRRGGTAWGVGDQFVCYNKSLMKSVSETEPGFKTYRVKAYDMAGNVGGEFIIVMWTSLPNGTAYQQIITDAMTYLPETSPGPGPVLYSKTMIELGCLYAPVNLVRSWVGVGPATETQETWQQHFENNGWTSMQDAINAGYTAYAEPTPLASYDSATGVGDCYCYMQHLACVGGTGGAPLNIDYCLTSGAKIKIDYDRENIQGQVDVFMKITIAGYDMSGNTYSRTYTNVSEIVIGSDFAYVDAIYVVIYFRTATTGPNLVKLSNIRYLFTWPLISVEGTKAIGATGSASIVILNRPFSAILSAIANYNGTSNYGGAIDQPGFAPTYLMSTTGYLKNRATGAGVAGNIGYRITAL